MAQLTQLLGNRELAFEDQLEKGRVWIYGDGNEYTALCNGFCWRAPGTGCVVIEIYGAGGSSGRGCCCGMGLPSNPGSYARKCICVVAGNFICGSGGRACGDTPQNGRGDPEAIGLCWFGCSPAALFNGGDNPKLSASAWKGNNPWGYGNGETLGNIDQRSSPGKYHTPRSNNAQASTVCCVSGHDRGCMCAQGGQSGYWQCTDGGMSGYQCFMRTRFCSRQIHAKEICGSWACSIVCNVCSDFSNQFSLRGIRCAFGGDMNCCGTFSCSRFLNCTNNNPGCTFQYQQATPPMRYSTEGGVYTYPMDHDSPASPTSGGAVLAQASGISSMMRSPSHLPVTWCWSGARACGCYEAWGCIPFAPSGMGGYPTNVCGDVRDHGGRGGMGTVRIRYVPATGGTSY